ncbi:MAG: DUF5305 domain-containing protein [Candidatus Nomurabacteria bacterium]|jgi:hypothetical protein|nr:DUF5305 domain-containing protein [Candidatus Nomurabacteria bacterium]
MADGLVESNFNRKECGVKTIVQREMKTAAHENHLMLRVAFIIAFGLLLGFGAVMYFIGWQREAVDYSENGSAGYDVCLKPNNYFADRCQAQGKQYIASIINTVKAKFNYTFHSSAAVDSTYSYRIDGRVTATDSDDGGDDAKTLYDDTTNLLPTKTAEANGLTHFSIADQITINYDKYNDLINQFRSDYALTLKAQLDLIMHIDISSNFAGETKTISRDLKVSIPLSQRTINVGIDTAGVDSTGQILHKSRAPILTLIYVAMMSAGGVGLLIVLIISLVLLGKRESARSDYEVELDKILHSYNQLIVDAERIPNIPDANTVKVDSFDELLDARDTIQRPIIHIKLSPSKSLFAIEDGKMAYCYLLEGKEPNYGKQQKGKTPGGGRLVQPDR